MLHDSDHTQQHCYFADMAYETKVFELRAPMEQCWVATVMLSTYVLS